MLEEVARFAEKRAQKRISMSSVANPAPLAALLTRIPLPLSFSLILLPAPFGLAYFAHYPAYLLQNGRQSFSQYRTLRSHPLVLDPHRAYSHPNPICPGPLAIGFALIGRGFTGSFFLLPIPQMVSHCPFQHPLATLP